MSDAVLRNTASGQWTLEGTLDFASVPAVWPSVADAIRGHKTVNLSLAAINKANSAGLALLLEAHDLASQAGCRLQLSDIPPELLDLASMSQCEGLIASSTG